MDGKNSLVKRAVKLTHKSLYPSNLERQQLALVVNIFNDFNAVALEMRKKDRDNDTALFIRLITAWWRVVNVKHPGKGRRLRDSLTMPILQTTEYRLEFFELLSQWLKDWEAMIKVNGGQGGLTSQTFRSLTPTTTTIPHLARYCLNKLDINYILLGKVQTDNLEKRFGEYRQLSGGNYNISVQQVLESEKKLRISSLLSLSSSKHGTISVRDLTDLLSADDDNMDSVCIMPETFKGHTF